MNREERYWFANEIGLVWFKLLSKIEAAGKLEAFKAEIGNKTMIGEYVGNVKHQHLVPYVRETIMFYAIVENEGITDCIDPAISCSTFKKYGLDCVSFESRGIYSTLEDVKKCISQDYYRIAVESLENEEEGIVMYLVARGLAKDYTLSLCKIKTLEYRIYRKARETIKNQLRQSLSI